MTILGAHVDSCTVVHASAPASAGPGVCLVPCRQSLDVDEDDRSPVLLLGRSPGRSCLGDLDADGGVDFDDLLRLLAPLPADFDSPAGIQDLNGDADRDADDVLVLLTNWGPCGG